MTAVGNLPPIPKSLRLIVVVADCGVVDANAALAHHLLEIAPPTE
jgi:hypothetical protein